MMMAVMMVVVVGVVVLRTEGLEVQRDVRAHI